MSANRPIPDESRQAESTNADKPERSESDSDYDPGDTLSRGMNLGCSLVILFFALVSCGFIASVLSQHR
jgi:hypothetical protein